MLHRWLGSVACSLFLAEPTLSRTCMESNPGQPNERDPEPGSNSITMILFLFYKILYFF